ncbi:hypothetical protein acdb102_21060 [Acidothermaceae bacterium B102]|nr:hypothetical protein acdb102_21060 [Acidothermaceae bacterium B102]
MTLVPPEGHIVDIARERGTRSVPLAGCTDAVPMALPGDAATAGVGVTGAEVAATAGSAEAAIPNAVNAEMVRRARRRAGWHAAAVMA